ncbi:MAG: putative transposase [Candidatus Giovannonibacteria bacterium GW2011_GWB1_45_9b]|uniref:Transposase IS200-like domain-containing protein n=6 Tax=Candidatus Giovannoniibacteriota TaxID=1752738 RepID=A0A1F5X0V1_9BACT|nr:MAG: putative transposase [Candidatus Giovannonibacteria bacterium GW2011_GWC2_44_8]KKU16601.1 MAG: putative transposase [Candidatus Giovannonibacteria bacterium GW2011_GWB1_45_9b]OGF73729.1 MAG: hypothetical protein A2W57_03880 [Candidatus Giovannonibacteria bacterium RIFCSPHIGHO2_02_43_16]OGF81516.1 MAG: hypothetical protein A2W48_01765 [Candidatus Giovannonibacteria bacterium RIFCSPHIGHO2_12_44_12]OGF84132.1 MAG: hypothetical protein A2Z63_02995 [Candidatus Giovannonibacteria bacterium RI
MRKIPFISGSFYHIYAHTVSDILLFQDNNDQKRFLNILFLANSESSLPRLDRAHDLNLVWDARDGKLNLGQPLVQIIAFCLMPNHFHFLLGEGKDGNISKFMHKILVSFSKYTNLKYERRGHLFESNFHSKPLEDNNYLLRASCYIHLNPKDISNWNNQEENYFWSSYADYVKENRWGNLLSRDIIMSQFENDQSAYQKFVEETRPEVSDLDTELP